MVCAMTVTPLGDSALVLALGEDGDESALAKVRAVADALTRAHIDGVEDVIPAFATVTVCYDASRSGPYPTFERNVSEIAGRATEASLRALATQVIEIPVCYGGEHGPDIDDVARRAGLSVAQVLALHSGTEYRVHAIGFVPGFAYLGGLPNKLHMPRRTTPRPVVQPGSVAIGGTQTGVYSLPTPGGWNIIGRTPLTMFDIARPQPALLHAGDRVKFRVISPEEFSAWK
jgi:inhibitor of KinA